MIQYKKFVEKYFLVIQLIIAITVCASILMYLIVAAKLPLSAAQLHSHSTNLLAIKKDLSNITKIEGASLKVQNDKVIVQFTEADCTLKAVFDTEGNYIGSEIFDTRIGKSAGACFMLTLMAFLLTFGLTFVIKGAFYIPILAYALLQKIKKTYY